MYLVELREDSISLYDLFNVERFDIVCSLENPVSN